MVDVSTPATDVHIHRGTSWEARDRITRKHALELFFFRRQE